MSAYRRLAALTLACSFTPLLLSLPAQSTVPSGTWSTDPRPGVTFGGSGIVGPVMQTQIGADGPWLTLGATPRYDNAALGNDGNGTFFATPGADACTTNANAGCPNPLYARWNFNFAVSGSAIDQFDYQLWYALTPDGSSGLEWTGLPLGTPIANTVVPFQGSLNIGMPSLFSWAQLNNPAVDPVNLNALGTYRYALVAYTSGTDQIVGEVAIAVQTSRAVVAEPSTLALMVLGALGLMLAHRRRMA